MREFDPEQLEPDDEGMVTCPFPDCGRRLSPRGLGLHMARSHDYRRSDAGDQEAGDQEAEPNEDSQRVVDQVRRRLEQRRQERDAARARQRRRMPEPGKPPPPPTINLGEEHGRLIESLAMVGTFTSIIAPHTGITILSRAGDRELEMQTIEGQQPERVRRRGIASLVMDYAARDPRILRGVVMFNNVMHAGEAIQLGMELAAAVAVDVRAVSPHMAIPMPGVPGTELRPVEALIGDVVQEVEHRYATAAEMGQDGAAPAPEGSAAGGWVPPAQA